jgi:hypothetical protein
VVTRPRIGSSRSPALMLFHSRPRTNHRSVWVHPTDSTKGWVRVHWGAATLLVVSMDRCLVPSSAGPGVPLASRCSSRSLWARSFGRCLCRRSRFSGVGVPGVGLAS